MRISPRRISQAIVRTTHKKGSATPRIKNAALPPMASIIQLKFMPKKPVNAVTGRKISDTKSQPVDLLALTLSKRRRIIVHHIGHPPAAFVELLLDVLDLFGVFVEFLRAARIHAGDRLDANDGGSHRAAETAEARREGLKLLHPARQRIELGGAGVLFQPQSEIIEAQVEIANGVIERAEQQLQKDSGRVIGTFAKSAGAFRELLPDFVQCRGVAAPQREDASPGAEKMHFEKRAGRRRHPGRRAQSCPPMVIRPVWPNRSAQSMSHSFNPRWLRVSAGAASTPPKISSQKNLSTAARSRTAFAVAAGRTPRASTIIAVMTNLLRRPRSLLQAEPRGGGSYVTVFRTAV